MSLTKTLKVYFVVPTEGTDHKDSELFVARMEHSEIPRKGDEIVHSYQQWEVTNVIRNYDGGDKDMKILLKNVGTPTI